MTPIAMIIVREYDIFTVDTAGIEELQGVGDTPEKAHWIAFSLAQYHGVPLQVD